MATAYNTKSSYRLRCLLNILAVVLACVSAARAEDGDAVTLLRWIPADVGFTVVIKNVHELDQAFARVARRVGLSVDESALCSWVRSEGPLGGWLDVSRPIAFAGRPGAAQGGVIAWGHVANLAARIAQSDGARNDNGVWCMPDAGEGERCLRTLGAYIVAARGRPALERMTEGGISLVDVRRGTRDLLRAGDGLAHVDMESYRDRALAFIGEIATLGPLTGLLIGQQLEGGGEETEALVAAIVDGAEELVRQSQFVDIGFLVGAEAVDVTCLVSFEKGAVRRYLNKQKPAAAAPFQARAGRPCFVALRYDVPSGDPGGGVYLLDKVLRHLTHQRTGSAAGMPRGTGAGHRVTTPALSSLRLLTDIVHRVNMCLAMESGTLVVSGDCDTTKAHRRPEQVGTSRSFGPPGAEPTKQVRDHTSGLRRLGEAGVERIPVKWGRAVPGLARLMAEDAALAFTEQSDRTRFCLGGSDAVHAFFGQAAGRSPSPRTAAALAALPERANVVLLVDAARTLAVLRRLWGASVGGTPAPGPIVALSVSLNAGQVTLHLHLPLGAIERLQDVLGHSDQS